MLNWGGGAFAIRRGHGRMEHGSPSSSVLMQQFRSHHLPPPSLLSPPPAAAADPDSRLTIRNRRRRLGGGGCHGDGWGGGAAATVTAEVAVTAAMTCRVGLIAGGRDSDCDKPGSPGGHATHLSKRRASTWDGTVCGLRHLYCKIYIECYSCPCRKVKGPLTTDQSQLIV